MSSTRIMARWAAYVLRGEGKNRSDSNERYTYRGVVLYSNEWPVSRLVKGPGKDWTCITKTGMFPRNPPEWRLEHPVRPMLTDSIIVPCVGVFSGYEGDMLDDAKLHERIKWLAHCQAQALVEKAQLWPADKLLLKTKWGSMTAGAELERDLDNVMMRYRKYSDLFALDWPDLPAHYARDLRRICADRSEDYYDPKAVAGRERQIARREAKRALGLQ